MVRKTSAIQLTRNADASQYGLVDVMMRQTSCRSLFQRKSPRKKIVSSAMEVTWRMRRKVREVVPRGVDQSIRGSVDQESSVCRTHRSLTATLSHRSDGELPLIDRSTSMLWC